MRVLNRGLDVTGFLNSLYQWAATLTSSGQNMPFALPIRADKVDQGFQVRQHSPSLPDIYWFLLQMPACSLSFGTCLQMSLLRIKDGTPMSVGDIVGSVESVEGKVMEPASTLMQKHSASPARRVGQTQSCIPSPPVFRPEHQHVLPVMLLSTRNLSSCVNARVMYCL